MAPSQTPADDPRVVLRNASGDEAVVGLQGGQLLSWTPAGEADRIYLSALPAAPGKAVRGGAPICFPQFAERGPLPKHGFVRTLPWELVASSAASAAVAEARFQLASAMSTTEWKHSCGVVLVARLGPRWLELQLQVANTGRAGFDFTGAIHTYLAVDDVRRATLHGLAGLDYEDALAANALKREQASSLSFADEIDRVYRQVPGALVLQEPGKPALQVTQQGFKDAVVWNPGPAKAARLGDMPAGDWVRMLCIEAAAVAQPVRLDPGRTWSGLQRLQLTGAA